MSIVKYDDNKRKDYVETAEELELVYDNQFNELTKKWIFITRLQVLPPQFKALFKIFPFGDLDQLVKPIFSFS